MQFLPVPIPGHRAEPNTIQLKQPASRNQGTLQAIPRARPVTELSARLELKSGLDSSLWQVSSLLITCFGPQFVDSIRDIVYGETKAPDLIMVNESQPISEDEVIIVD